MVLNPWGSYDNLEDGNSHVGSKLRPLRKVVQLYPVNFLWDWVTLLVIVGRVVSLPWLHGMPLTIARHSVPIGKFCSDDNYS